MYTWNRFRFRMNTDWQRGPRWWIDLYVMDTVIRDVIIANKAELSLWRMHRRANNDAIGHQVSLSCYTTANAAIGIEEAIQGHECFKSVRDALTMKCLRELGGEAIDEISDASWPQELRKSWPHYICGVSQMLLDLIEQVRPQRSADTTAPDIVAVESLYTEVERRLTHLWEQHGSHAFLHHLNALFGYVPLLAQPRSIAAIKASF